MTNRLLGFSPVVSAATILLVVAVLITGIIPLPTNGAVMASGAASDSYGINGHIATRYGIYGHQDGPAQVLADSGAGWDREEFRWDVVQPEPNKWDWGFTDEMVAKVHGRGISILGLLSYSTGWSSGQATAGPVHSMPNLDDWANYVAQVVGRYKDRVHYWEVWNEENHPIFWKPAPNAADYTRLLKITYQTIKRVDPNATVLIGGTAGVDTAYLNEVVANGGWPYFDILAVHPYVAPHSPEKGQLVQADLMKAKAFVDRNGGKPIWITEIGWPSSTGPWGVGGDEAQANYVVRALIQAAAVAGIDKVIMYNLRDDGTDHGNDENNYGLIENDWRTPKAAYNAFRTMSSLLSGSSFAGRFDLFENTRSVVNDFESDQQWRPWGDGATGSLYRSGDTAHRGFTSGRVDYQLNVPGKNYIDLSRSTSLPGAPTKAGLWVKGDSSGHLMWMTFRDSTNELFQYRVGNIGSGWQEYEISLSNCVRHTDGNNNGVIDYPLRFESFIVDNEPDGWTGSGTIYIDDLYVEEGLSFFGYRYEKSGANIDVIWTDGQGGNVNLPTLSATAEVFDRSGGKQTISSSNGALTLAVGENPIYVVHSAPQASPPSPAAAIPGEVPVGRAAQSSDPNLLYFNETGHNLGYGFRSYWEKNGGLMQFGFPITDEFGEVNPADGRTYTVQYFERARFEYHPENRGTAYEVLLGHLGKQVSAGRDFPKCAVFSSTPNSIYFRETGHSLSAGFLAYWKANGGLATYGYPISEEFSEVNPDDGRSYTVQYFERARFEYHPENGGTRFEVLQGLLGKKVLRDRGLIN